jgi:hypothetical protein
MKLSSIRKGVLLVAAAGTFALGCELIVDFDRTKIPVEGSDSATEIDASLDAQFDTSQPDAADAADAFDAADAVNDASNDAPDGD